VRDSGYRRFHLWRDCQADTYNFDFASPFALNNNQEVVGQFNSSSGIWSPSGTTLLPFLGYLDMDPDPGAVDNWFNPQAFGLNDNGQVSISIQQPLEDGPYQYRQVPGIWLPDEEYGIPISLPDSYHVQVGVTNDHIESISINNLGHVFGRVNDINSGFEIGPFFWGGSFQLMGAPPGGYDFYVWAINNLDQAIGESYSASNPWYLWSQGSYTELNFAPLDLNDEGQIVGQLGNEAVLQENGQLYRLPLPAGYNRAIATSINNRGEIVGAASGSGFGNYALVKWIPSEEYDSGNLVDLIEDNSSQCDPQTSLMAQEPEPIDALVNGSPITVTFFDYAQADLDGIRVYLNDELVNTIASLPEGSSQNETVLGGQQMELELEDGINRLRIEGMDEGLTSPVTPAFAIDPEQVLEGARGVWAQLPEGGSTQEFTVAPCPPPQLEDLLDSVTDDRQRKLLESMLSATNTDKIPNTNWWTHLVRSGPESEPDITRAYVLNELIAEAIENEFSDLQVMILASQVVGESNLDPTIANGGALGLIQYIYEADKEQEPPVRNNLIAAALGITRAELDNNPQTRNNAALTLETGVRLAVQGMKEGLFVRSGGLATPAPNSLTPGELNLETPADNQVVSECQNNYMTPENNYTSNVLKCINWSVRNFIIEGSPARNLTPYIDINIDFVNQYRDYEQRMICEYSSPTPNL
jgi:hypothetical protein